MSQPTTTTKSNFRLSERSKSRLVGVHPDLVRVVTRAIQITTVDFGVAEGLRTVARQRTLVAVGASKTINSRHIPDVTGTGHAVDLVAYIGTQVHWDWPLYTEIALAMKAAALELGVQIEWGGDWKTFKDGPHFQLPVSKYPNQSKPKR